MEKNKHQNHDNDKTLRSSERGQNYDTTNHNPQTEAHRRGQEERAQMDNNQKNPGDRAFMNK